MNRIIRKLLRQHISIGQLAGFFFANLFGMVIILLGIQFYQDITPVLTQGDSFLKQDYLIASKRVSTLGSLSGKSNTFSAKEIAGLKEQAFTRNVGAFTPSLFNVSAGVKMEGTGIQLSTAMFFESVPDEYVDVHSDKWHFNEGDGTIPIIIPRNYLNLYNFGFAQSRGLPKLSEGVMGMINMDITLRGAGTTKHYKGNIVGFSNRLNTILVPESFMQWANHTLVPAAKAEPSRLIVEVNNPADPAIAEYFRAKGYETEGDKLDAGKTAYFLNLLVGIVVTVGLVISALSFYILMLSIFLLLQKNTEKIQNLLLIGYSQPQIALPYQALTAGLNLLVLLISLVVVFIIRGAYLDPLRLLLPQLTSGSIWPTLGIGALLFLAVTLINGYAIRRRINSLFYR